MPLSHQPTVTPQLPPPKGPVSPGFRLGLPKRASPAALRDAKRRVEFSRRGKSRSLRWSRLRQHRPVGPLRGAVGTRFGPLSSEVRGVGIGATKQDDNPFSGGRPVGAGGASGQGGRAVLLAHTAIVFPQPPARLDERLVADK